MEAQAKNGKAITDAAEVPGTAEGTDLTAKQPIGGVAQVAEVIKGERSRIRRMDIPIEYNWEKGYWGI